MSGRLDPRVKAMSEATLQEAIIDLAELSGWKVTFAPDWMKRLAVASMQRQRRRDRRWPKAGTPDLIMVKAGRMIVAELKSHTGQVKPEQAEWLDELRTVAGVDVFVWRPDEWVSGEIEQEVGGQ